MLILYQMFFCPSICMDPFVLKLQVSGSHLPMVSRTDSVRSYVGITMSLVLLEPHQEKMGWMWSVGFLFSRGQSPRLTKNSRSGRRTCTHGTRPRRRSAHTVLFNWILKTSAAENIPVCQGCTWFSNCLSMKELTFRVSDSRTASMKIRKPTCSPNVLM